MSLTVAGEILGGRGEDELVLQGGGRGALGDTRLDVVSLDPRRQPLKAAVAVERVRAQRPEKHVISR